MSDLATRIAKAAARADLDEGDGTYDWYALTEEVADRYYAIARDAIGADADRLTLYETALRTIQEAATTWLRPDSDMTNRQLIDIVLGAVDNQELVRAMRTSEPSNAIVDEGMEG